MMPIESEHDVLIAEDDLVSRVRLAHLLESWGYRVSAASDGNEAWQILQSPYSPLLAILDWSMPGLDGIEICRRLKSDSDRRYGYVIMLTANNTTPDVVAALTAGADDFVAKPYSVDELRVRLRAGQRIVDLHRDLKRRASHDDLTGLLNRRMIIEMLAREQARAQRESSMLGVAMLDIDNFKGVNDTLGHIAGDAVLQETGGRIRASVRQNDIAGRYGGEEFLLVMPGCDATTAAAIANRVASAISATPMMACDHEVSVTASIGVAAAMPSETRHTALIIDADRALYRAKQRGRNRVEVAGGGPPP